MEGSVFRPEVSEDRSDDVSLLLVFEGILPNEQEDAIRAIATEIDTIITDIRLLLILPNMIYP